MSTTTLSLVNATTRPSVIVPSSRFLKVSSYRAAKASRSNCGSFDFETVLMGTVLLFRQLSGADDQCHRSSLSIANTGAGVMLRRDDPAQGGDPLHHDSTHFLIKLLRLLVPFPRKKQGRSKRYGHGMKPRPLGSGRQDLKRTFEMARKDRPPRLGDNHAQSGLGLPQVSIETAAPLGKNHDHLPGLDQRNRLIEGLAIEAPELERNPPEPLQYTFHACHEQVAAAH